MEFVYEGKSLEPTLVSTREHSATSDQIEFNLSSLRHNMNKDVSTTILSIPTELEYVWVEYDLQGHATQPG